MVDPLYATWHADFLKKNHTHTIILNDFDMINVSSHTVLSWGGTRMLNSIILIPGEGDHSFKRGSFAASRDNLVHQFNE